MRATDSNTESKDGVRDRGGSKRQRKRGKKRIKRREDGEYKNERDKAKEERKRDIQIRENRKVKMGKKMTKI